jgi:type II secretory ATPase GspE/PulE/Tfp pilus assembly ATPase PilB-like protein
VLDDDDLDALGDDDDELTQPAVRLVDELLRAAVAVRASAVHIVPGDDVATVRLRVDGTMRPWDSVPRALLRSVTARLKILASLDIAERRVPQNGGFALREPAAKFMLLTLPTARGDEAIVLRRAETPDAWRDLNDCGYGPDLLPVLERAAAARAGLVVIAGPSGAGRATTRYALLARALAAGRVVMTAEEVVRRVLPGATQMALDHHLVTMDRALSAIGRSDPDVVMVSDLMDTYPVEWSLKRALDGRLVIASLHVGRATDVSVRFLDMGLPPYLVSTALRAVVAQRLVRRLCTCRRPERLTPEVAMKYGLPDTVHRAGGCDECAGTGWAGRTLVAEGFEVGQAERDAIARAERVEPRVMRTLRDHALALVATGVTSLAEALTVDA